MLFLRWGIQRAPRKSVGSDRTSACAMDAKPHETKVGGGGGSDDFGKRVDYTTRTIKARSNGQVERE